MVTGAASGIGEAIAKKLSSEGASVAICDLDCEGGIRVVQEIQSLGGNAAFYSLDVTKEEQV